MTNASPHTEHHDHAHHAIPLKRLMWTFGWLIVLTILTVITGGASWIPSLLHVPLALTIAAVKCYLVVSYFMGLKYDKPVNMLSFVMSGVFVLIFLTFTLFDTANRGDLGNVDPRTVRDIQAIAAADSVRERELLERYGRDGKLLVAPGDSATSSAAAGASAAAVDSATASPAEQRAPVDSAATATPAPASATQ